MSGVPQGPLLFLIMIIDIDKGISPSSKLVSFADDTMVYSCINDIDKLQIDLNSVYDWAHVNNMFFNAQKFNYVSFNGSMMPCGSNVYTNPNMEIISPSYIYIYQGMFLTWVTICPVTAPLIIIFLVCLKSILICQGGF